MANGPTRVCVFNVKPGQQFAAPIVPAQTGSNLIDVVTGCDGVTVPSLGPASYGVPVVLNPNGVIDSSLMNTGVSIVAGVNLQLGAPLVNLYSNGGVLTARYADAGGGSPPSPAYYAQGFLTSPIDAGLSGTIAFSGLFTYIDPNSEFSLSSVGAEVYLSAVTPGGITLTRPSSPSLDQTVGYVVAFAAPNVVTAIFLAGFNDFTRISGCLATTQLCSVQGTGVFVQLTGGAPPPSPVTTHLGVSANYAILAAAGITNAAPATSVTGGTIGSFPTTSITGFNPPTATVDNAGASAALTAALAAYTFYSGLTFTSLSGSTANLSVLGNGANASTYNAGVYAGGALDIPTTITLDAQGNPNALFVFISASTTVLHSGASILLVNGAQAANVVWCVGSSFTSVATSTMVGNILANTSITLGGGILTGRALAVGGGNGAVTISAATAVTVPSGAGSIIAGDIVTFDVNGNTLDSGISLAGVLSSIFVNPMTTAGDIIYETSGPLGPARLPIGATGQALTVVGGFPAWGNAVNSFNTRTGAVTFSLTDIPQSGATTGQAIVWNGSAWVPSSAATTSFTDILTGTNTTAVMTVGSGASIVVTGTGVVEATQLATTGAAVDVSGAAPPTVGQALVATSATTATWQNVSGGSPTQIQYNLGGAFAGIAGSSVTAAGAVALDPTGTGVALTVTGDNAGSDILNLNAYNGGTPVLVNSTDQYGNLNIAPAAGGSTAALSVTGDGTNDIVDFSVFGGVNNPVAYMDPGGVLWFQTTTGTINTTSIGPSSVILSANSSNFITTMNGDHIEVQDGTNLSYLTYESLGFGDTGSQNVILSYMSTGVMAIGNTTGIANRTLALGGLATGIVTETTTYTAGPYDHTINCDATGGAFTLTLPTTGIKVGQEYYIKKIDSSANAVTVSSSVNIDGSLTQTLGTQYQSITVQWDGTQWWIY